jgi:Zn-dependent protease with chaperone function
MHDIVMPVVTDEMRTYSHIRYALYFVSVAYACAVQFVLMSSGNSSRWRNMAESITTNRCFQFLIYFGAFYVITLLAMAPLTFFAGFILEHQFHLTHQSFFGWIEDFLKHAGLGAVLSAPGLAAFFFLVKKFPRRWPILFCVIICALIAVEMFISPIVLEPALNRFSAMAPGSLRTSIEQLAAKAGAPGAPIFVADKSKQTDKLNAYVSGIGPSTHIVIWDTTLARLPEDQVLAIVGHELGHYYLHHELIDFFLLVGVNVLIVPVNALLAKRFAKGLPPSFGVRGLDDFAITPCLVLVTALGMFLSDPIQNAWSRTQEHAADAFSLQVTGNGRALAQSFVSLSQQNLSEPDPPAFIEFWLFSHPSLKERIEFASGQTK